MLYRTLLWSLCRAEVRRLLAYAVTDVLSYTICITTDLGYMQQNVTCTQSSGLMIYKYDFIDYHICISLNQKYV